MNWLKRLMGERRGRRRVKEGWNPCREPQETPCKVPDTGLSYRRAARLSHGEIAQIAAAAENMRKNQNPREENHQNA